MSVAAVSARPVTAQLNSSTNAGNMRWRTIFRVLE